MTQTPDLQTAPSIADLVERLAPVVHGLAGRRGHLGAVLPWREGVLVASAAAVGRERRLQAMTAHGARVELDVIGIDPDTDVAALRPLAGEDATAPALPSIDRSAPAAPRTGDFVFALAHDPHCGVQASFGRLGAVGGPWRSGRGGGEMSAHWRLDGGLYPGFEGALVADAQGRLLGLASSAFSRAHGVIVPAETVDRVVDALLRDGRVARPYLGVLLQPARVRVEGDGAAAGHVDGALVASLAEDGPGDAGGLRVGDVVVGLGGQVVDSPPALHRHLAAQAAGGTVAVEIVRGGARLTFALALGTRPDPADDPRCGRGHGHHHGHGHGPGPDIHDSHGTHDTHGEARRSGRQRHPGAGREGVQRE
jgi:S1-C subfamily serine protease